MTTLKQQKSHIFPPSSPPLFPLFRSFPIPRHASQPAATHHRGLITREGRPQGSPQVPPASGSHHPGPPSLSTEEPVTPLSPSFSNRQHSSTFAIHPSLFPPLFTPCPLLLTTDFAALIFIRPRKTVVSITSHHDARFEARMHPQVSCESNLVIAFFVLFSILDLLSYPLSVISPYDPIVA